MVVRAAGRAVRDAALRYSSVTTQRHFLLRCCSSSSFYWTVALHGCGFLFLPLCLLLTYLVWLYRIYPCPATVATCAATYGGVTRSARHWINSRIGFGRVDGRLLRLQAGRRWT